MVRISIVHQGALGDTILLVPLFRSLRQRFSAGGCHITIITRTNLGQMLMLLGFVDAHASAEDRDHTLWFASPDGLHPNSLPEWSNCDLMISFVSSGNDAWARNAKFAMQPPASGYWQIETPLLFVDPRPPADFAGHVTEWHRSQLETLDLYPPPAPLPRKNPDGPVVIHPGSGGDAKCWPREKFLSLGRTLKRNGILPTFILGEAEQERWGFKVVDELKEEFPWYLHMGLYELGEKLSRVRLYVGNDSGVSHLAGAVGVPVIALFGPSNDRQWTPIGADGHVKILRAEHPHETDLANLDEAVVLNEMLAELRKIE
ncbi:MAG TPA: glycosyltransferase family 9 protein [Phycisphaerae bacterium]|nr:glycosyltransferase family 9 protein [Phycisphaerae bacterium]